MSPTSHPLGDDRRDKDEGSGGRLRRLSSPHGARSRGVASALVEYAREREAALLVVGSRGRSAVRQIILGSVAMATLHHAYRPVLVVSAADHQVTAWDTGGSS